MMSNLTKTIFKGDVLMTKTSKKSKYVDFEIYNDQFSATISMDDIGCMGIIETIVNRYGKGILESCMFEEEDEDEFNE